MNPTKTPVEILLQAKEDLQKLKDLNTHVEKVISEVRAGGRSFEEWKSSLEGHAINDIIRSITQGRNLPVTDSAITRIPQDNGIKYSHGYGRWIESTTPEMLEAWIAKNIGDPNLTEVKKTINDAFPPYLREPNKVFDDKKCIISRHVGGFENDFNSVQMKLRWNFDAKPWICFIRLAEALAQNLEFNEVDPVLPDLFTQDIKWERRSLYAWHHIPQNSGVIAIRPMVGGEWKFELGLVAYGKMKTLGLASFATRKDEY